VTWERTFENYLDSLKGKSKIPLSYIIRPADVDATTATSDYQRMIWQAPHAGYAFEEDNRKVYRTSGGEKMRKLHNTVVQSNVHLKYFLPSICM
jgi:hypothetical protein